MPSMPLGENPIWRNVLAAGNISFELSKHTLDVTKTQDSAVGTFTIGVVVLSPERKGEYTLTFTFDLDLEQGKVTIEILNGISSDDLKDFAKVALKLLQNAAHYFILKTIAIYLANYARSNGFIMAENQVALHVNEGTESFRVIDISFDGTKWHPVQIKKALTLFDAETLNVTPPDEMVKLFFIILTFYATDIVRIFNDYGKNNGDSTEG